jgi:hypothetical protein
MPEHQCVLRWLPIIAPPEARGSKSSRTVHLARCGIRHAHLEPHGMHLSLPHHRERLIEETATDPLTPRAKACGNRENLCLIDHDARENITGDTMCVFRHERNDTEPTERIAQLVFRPRIGERLALEFRERGNISERCRTQSATPCREFVPTPPVPRRGDRNRAAKQQDCRCDRFHPRAGPAQAMIAHREAPHRR